MDSRSSITAVSRRRSLAILLASLLLACGSGPGRPNAHGTGQETDFSVLVSPERQVDILFVVDNSPSMDPKQEALVKAFPKMIEVLQKVPGGLPDLHIGVISSDMGAGGGESGGNCDVVLGNRGLLWGNDPSVDPASQRNKYATVKNLKNAAGADGCGMGSGQRWIEDTLNADSTTRTKNYQGDLADVFSCLATSVGVNGCEFEHQLQSLRVALNPSAEVNPKNYGFLRPSAYLAVVIITDEDDCSADPTSKTNGGMFATRTPGDTASLRCAARGHVCGGRDIPDYDPASGYSGQKPFVAKLSDCDAKDIERQPSQNDQYIDPTYQQLPLIRIRDMIDSVNQVKDRSSDQILAFGLIGWPQNGKLDGVEYRIDKDATSKPAEQQKLWDYMPICSVSDQESADGNIYKAYGGFRLKKFLDAFKQENETNLFSICQPDFSDALAKIGTTIGNRFVTGCIRSPLADADANLPGIQAECSAIQKVRCDDYQKGNCSVSGYEETVIEQCRDGQGKLLDQDHPQIEKVSAEARPCWYLRHDVDEFGCSNVPGSLRPLILAGRGGLPRGAILAMQCATCPDGQPGCSVER
jgi:hypothetical protein